MVEPCLGAAEEGPGPACRCGGVGADEGLQEEGSLVKGGRKEEGGGETEEVPGWEGSQERSRVCEDPQAAGVGAARRWEPGTVHHGAFMGRAQQKREIVALALRQTGDSG